MRVKSRLGNLLVWCNTPLLITTSKKSCFNAGRKRFICANVGRFSPFSVFELMCHRSEFRHMSIPQLPLPVCDGQKVRQLPGTAPTLQNTSANTESARSRAWQSSGCGPFPAGLAGYPGRRNSGTGLLVKLFDDLCDIALRLAQRFRGNEQPRYPILHWITFTRYRVDEPRLRLR